MELIELLKIEKPSLSLAELSCLEEMDSVDVSMVAVSRALKQRLPSCPYTRKKLQRSPVKDLLLRTCFIYSFSSIISVNIRLSHFSQPVKSGMNIDLIVESVKVTFSYSDGNLCTCCKLSHENIFNFVNNVK